MGKQHAVAVMVTAAILVAATSVWGGGFVLSRHAVNGGGVMRSIVGSYELSGTIGQPDAGPASAGMTDGAFELTGGFWFAQAPGDCNTDGGVNLLDYEAFEACLTGPLGGMADSSCVCFDRDGDDDVDITDFAAFQSSFQYP